MVRKATSELDSGRFKSRLAYRIYDDSSEDGAGDCLAFSRAGVGDSSHQLFVAASVQYSKDAENYDGEDGDDGARSESSQLANSLGGAWPSNQVWAFCRGWTYHDQACMALTTGFMVMRRRGAGPKTRPTISEWRRGGVEWCRWSAATCNVYVNECLELPFCGDSAGYAIDDFMP
jgi:hypothetical protein